MTPRAYYNEIDPYAAQWLRNLIAAGRIAPGDVDERSIEDVHPDDLRKYTQCHFFAGIGGWPLALRLAGWPDGRPVWTGSCPCQPFSAAGNRGGFDDERHLWPAWYWLLGLCRPAVVFGEQVASKAVEPWVDLVQADMEGLGYAFGAVPFPAAGVGAPHIRDRLYWVGDAGGARPQGRPGRTASEGQRAAVSDVLGGVGDSGGAGLGERFGNCRISSGASGTDKREAAQRTSIHAFAGAGPINGLWRAADWLFCRDGKWRPVEPGAFPLAHGISNRVGRLRAYGNAIVPQQAEAFIRAYLECRP